MDVLVNVQMDQRSASKYGVRGALLAALRPWLGEELLKKGVLIYLHEAGRIEVVTQATSLGDAIEADAIEVVVQAQTLLPSAPRAAPARRHAGDDDEQEPMFGGYDSLGDGTYYVHT